jgi:hypothetical protein
MAQLSVPALKERHEVPAPAQPIYITKGDNYDAGTFSELIADFQVPVALEAAAEPRDREEQAVTAAAVPYLLAEP